MDLNSYKSQQQDTPKFRPSSFVGPRVEESSGFSLGGLMMAILPEQLWPLVPESDLDNPNSRSSEDPNSSCSSGSLPDRFTCISSSSQDLDVAIVLFYYSLGGCKLDFQPDPTRFSLDCIVYCSVGLLEASVLLTGARVKGASFRKMNAMTVERLAAEEASNSEHQSLADDVSVSSSGSGSSTSDNASSLISQLINAPPVAKMRSPRGVPFKPCVPLRTLVEEEEQQSSQLSSDCEKRPLQL
ncbi:hypothetical protein Ciccas_002012 [Cichlidogyrus casuarinus]|uniref:Uncharacterized protein n=1 Tax=Cichlidogyrus casuarinus TaxID=1844966 RepID=A0ABD2QIH1_9PLAT